MTRKNTNALKQQGRKSSRRGAQIHSDWVCLMFVPWWLRKWGKSTILRHTHITLRYSAHAICSSADVNLVDSTVVHCPAAMQDLQDAKGMTTGKLLAASSSLSRVSQWMAAMLLLSERASVESATQPGLECLGLPCHDPWVTDASRSDQGNDFLEIIAYYSQSQAAKNVWGIWGWNPICLQDWRCDAKGCGVDGVVTAGMVWPQSLTSPILQVWLSTAFCGIKLGLPRRFLTR